MFNYVDLILLALVAFFVFTGIRKGFARTLLSFAARIASIVIAYFVSDTYAEVVYERFFKETLINAIESDFGSQLTGNIGEQIHSVWSVLPQTLLNIGESFGLDMLAIHGELDGVDISQGVSSVIEETVAGPIAVAICKIIVFAAASAVVSFVLAILVNLLCKVVKLPVLKTADKLLGAGLGLINGFICLFILSFIFTIVSGFISPPELADAIDSSYIIDFFAYANMLV